MKALVQSLARNTAFSAAAFLVAGVIGFLLVPFIINKYGLYAYGVLVLGRLFLPSGLISMLDFGVMEVATKRMARAGAFNTTAPNQAWGLLRYVYALSLILGLSLCGILAITAPWAASQLLVSSSAHDASALQSILLVTAIALPVLFLGLAAEGAERGRENFVLVRLTEIMAAFINAALVICIVLMDLHYVWIGYAFICGSVSRSLVLLASDLRRSFVRTEIKPFFDKHQLKEVIKEGTPFLHSKFLGAVNGHLPALLVGALAGATGAGIYDVIMRLPRFIKNVLAVTVSVIFPASARLDAARELNALSKLVLRGLTIVVFLCYPFISALIVFSQDVMTHWVGPDLAVYWPWVSLMFIALSTNLLLSFAFAVGMVRREVQIAANRLLLFQAFSQLVLSFAMYPFLSERAFVAGQASAMLIFFFPQLRLVLGALKVDIKPIAYMVMRHLIVFAVVLLVAKLTLSIIFTPTVVHLLILIGAWCLTFFSLAYLIALDDAGRASLRHLIHSFV